MSNLHLATAKEFTYLNYLAVMSAVRFNHLVIWHSVEHTSNWWKLVNAHRSIEFKYLDPSIGVQISMDESTGVMDTVGLLDLIYLREFTQESTDDALLIHSDLYLPADVGEFETKDMDVVRVFLPEDKENFDFLTPEWVKNSNTLLADLIQTVLFRRIWSPYER